MLLPALFPNHIADGFIGSRVRVAVADFPVQRSFLFVFGDPVNDIFHTVTSLIDLLPLLRLHRGNLPADALQCGSTVIGNNILRCTGHRIGQTVQRKVSAFNEVLEDTFLFLGIDAIALGSQLHHILYPAGDRHCHRFLQAADHLGKASLINGSHRGIAEFQQECLVLCFHRLIRIQGKAVLHCFCLPAHMMTAFAHVIDHHAVGADQTVYQRLNRHSSQTDLGVGDHHTSLDDITLADFHLQTVIFPLFAVIIVLVLAVCSFHIIPTGYTGVKTSFGQIQETTIQSGKLNFCIPFVQSIHKVNNKQQDKHIEAQVWGEASDKTPVYAADVIVTYQVLPEKSAWLYANVSDIKNLVGDELVASAIKSAMAELDPNEVTNRTRIEPLAQQKLAESLMQKYGEDVVFVNKVVINDMDFEDAYNEAIQQKSIAQQNADKQKIENEAAIAKAEADKQVAIANAEAEAQKTSIAADAQAEANRKLAESLSDTLIDYQKIQKWDGKLPTVSGGNALVSIDPAE